MTVTREEFEGLVNRVGALEHAIGNPVSGEQLEVEVRDPAAVGFEKYRARAHAREIAREKEGS